MGFFPPLIIAAVGWAGGTGSWEWDCPAGKEDDPLAMRRALSGLRSLPLPVF